MDRGRIKKFQIMYKLLAFKTKAHAVMGNSFFEKEFNDLEELFVFAKQHRKENKPHTPEYCSKVFKKIERKQ
jgi:hypothetical protein